MMDGSKQLPFVTAAAKARRPPGSSLEVSVAGGARVRLERAACALCGAADDEPIVTVTDWRYALTEDLFTIVRCRRCRLAYLNPRPAPGDMRHFYPGRYYDRRRTRSGDPLSNREPPASPRVAPRVLAEQAALCGGRPGRVLDVGCASGAFLARMRQSGWQVQGVEVSAEAAAWGSAELELDIVNRPLPEAGLPAASFDVVTYWSSLEHVHEPLAYLAETRRILKPEGRLIALLPNFSSPTVRWLHWGLDPPRHLYHFTPATLRRMLAKAGFTGQVAFRSRTGIEDGALHRQLRKIGRRMERSGRSHPRRPGLTVAGAAVERLALLLAPASWLLAVAGRNGAMIVIARAV
ncbi:MAG TPA: methyltransferase domain-containing protein [Candidatus Polarisedimenticolia bacterium]|nr:methyltransferase domain-containing protein [Candidatus Polarisedimenticolia bacterium]